MANEGRVMGAGVAALVALAWLSEALAQPGLTPPGETAPIEIVAEETPTSSEWYGWQIILADIGTVVMTAVTQDAGVFFAGYFIAPAIIHGAHGNGGKAVGSPLLRAGLPLAGGLAGAVAASDCNGSYCALGPIALGVLVGGAIGIITDWAWAKKSAKKRRGTIAITRCQGRDCHSLGWVGLW